MRIAYGNAVFQDFYVLYCTKVFKNGHMSKHANMVPYGGHLSIKLPCFDHEITTGLITLSSLS